MKKLVLHIPHSSNVIPLLEGYVSTQEEINQEIIKLTDWNTDDLSTRKRTIKLSLLFQEFSVMLNGLLMTILK
jgi:N-formylglutamate deformylase